MTIDILPDEALLEVFIFYLVERSERIEPWRTIVHVCRRWRSVVFASPRRLDVQVIYTPERQVKVMLDTWPNLPIHISARGHKAFPWHGEEQSLIAALEHTDHICQIQLREFSCSQLERISLAMQKPFPALTGLNIRGSNVMPMAVVPQAFLGGSAQHLRSCNLVDVEFPGYGNYFGPPITLLLFIFGIFPIPCTHRLREWPRASPRCPVSNHFPLVSNLRSPPITGLTSQTDVSHVLSCPLSLIFGSKS